QPLSGHRCAAGDNRRAGFVEVGVARAGVALRARVALVALLALDALDPLRAGVALVTLRTRRPRVALVALRPKRAGRELTRLELRGGQRAVLDLGAGHRICF